MIMQKAKEWVETKGKTIAGRWFLFFVMLVTALAAFMLLVPVAILGIAICIIYILGAGITSIFNEIFYHKPVDETFDELTDKLCDRINDLCDILDN